MAFVPRKISKYILGRNTSRKRFYTNGHLYFNYYLLQNPNFSMIIILPDEKDGLKEVERQLETMTLKNIRSRGKWEMVQLSLPKFKIESTIKMNSILQEVCM